MSSPAFERGARRPDIERAFAHLERGASGGEGDPVAAMRRMVDEYGDVEPRDPIPPSRVRPVRVGSVPGEWLTPDVFRSSDRILFLHGGGWIAGGCESHRPMAAALAAATGMAVLLLEYRLAPENPFPAGFEDCRFALSWIADHGPTGASPARIHLVGDSAGGNLAAAVCADVLATGGRPPARLVLMSPALEGSDAPARRQALPAGVEPSPLAEVMQVYLQGRTSLEDPRVSPLRTPAEILSRFPPTLVQASGAEFLYWDAEEFTGRLVRAGARVRLSVWPGLPHVWQAFLTLLPEAAEAIEEAAWFLRGSSRGDTTD